MDVFWHATTASESRWNAWLMEIPLSFSMHTHSEKDISCHMKKFVEKGFLVTSSSTSGKVKWNEFTVKVANLKEYRKFTTLRFLSTTRITHAGLLFGKHGTLLSHTWGAVVVNMLHSSTFRMLELFDCQHWSNAKAWISDVAQTWILTVLGEDQIVCEPSVVLLVQIRMTNCPLSHVHHPLHHRTLPLQDQVFCQQVPAIRSRLQLRRLA